MDSIIHQLLSLELNPIYFLAQSNASNRNFGIIDFIFLIFSIASYIFISYCFMKMYEKLKQPNAWFAFIPLLSAWIMYKAGDRSPWWIIGLFIPVFNIVAGIVLLAAYIKIVQKLGKNHWLILLTIIPLVNFWVMYHFALA